MSIALNIGIVRGLLTLALFFAFMTLWAWAWSKNRQADFERVAQLPLEEDGWHDNDAARGEPR